MNNIKIGVLALLIFALAAAGGYYLWNNMATAVLPDFISCGNGRIEAVEINIATKMPGRVKDILVHEGDFVHSGEILALMDTATLEAQLKEAQARQEQILSAIDIVKSQLQQRKSEESAARALITQHQAIVGAAEKRWQRSQKLIAIKAISQQQNEQDDANFLAAKAQLQGARAGLKAVEASIMTARAQLEGATSDVKAGAATVERIQAEVNDSTLTAPRDGRVQYRVAQPSEILGAGGIVLNMIDLSDVSMNFFLPTEQVGRLAIGSEARILLDAAPEYVIPAHISFVAAVAQFTPKSVETTSERQKLMFRVKAQIPAELLKQHITQVKTGLPGKTCVRLDSQQDWPASLQVKSSP